MGNVTSADVLLAGLPGQRLSIQKTALAAPAAAGAFSTLWRATGEPQAGAAGTSKAAGGSVPTSATAGAFVFTDAGGAQNSYLARAAASLRQGGTLLVYDRLWHATGFVFTSAASQAVTGAVAQTRPDAVGLGTELWLEVTAAPGGGPVTATATYTNTAGTAGRTATATISTGINAERCYRFALQAGDLGVKTVQAVQLSGALGAGTFEIVIARCLAEIPCAVAEQLYTMNAIDLGLPEVYDAAALYLIHLATGTTSPGPLGSLQIIAA